MKEMTHEWLLSAESDLLIIEKILQIDTLTHQIAFHAQQVIEKSFKAIIEEFTLDFVKTHALETLYNIVKGKITIYVNIDYLMMLDQMYIDARYPGELGLLPDGKPSLKEARAFYDFASLIFQETKHIVR